MNPMMTKPREIPVVLLPGDYQAEHDRLVREVDELEKRARSDKRLKAAALEAAEKVDAFHDPENIPGAIAVLVSDRNVSAKRIRQLQDECPPRDKNRRDEVFGYDEDAFNRRLVRECIVEPELTDEQFAEWADSAPQRHWAKVRDAALKVTGEGEEIPKSSAVSVLLAARAAASKQQHDTA